MRSTLLLRLPAPFESATISCERFCKKIHKHPFNLKLVPSSSGLAWPPDDEEAQLALLNAAAHNLQQQLDQSAWICYTRLAGGTRSSPQRRILGEAVDFLTIGGWSISAHLQKSSPHKIATLFPVIGDGPPCFHSVATIRAKAYSEGLSVLGKHIRVLPSPYYEASHSEKKTDIRFQDPKVFGFRHSEHFSRMANRPIWLWRGSQVHRKPPNQ